jgi:PKD repeat protein
MRPLVACVALALSLLLVQTASARLPVSAAKTRYAKVEQLCPPPAPGYATCFALARIPVAAGDGVSAASEGAAPYAVNDGASSSGPAGGLTPAQLASAYSYEPATGGSGQTVAIIDAYDDPAIEADLQTFDQEYGLAPCTKANGCFKKVSQDGSEVSLPAPDTTRWSVEITLDVETVHSVCEHCKILLVEANEPSNADLADGVNAAVALGATEVSNSYGGPEVGLAANERAAYDHPGVVIAVAGGDDGYDNWDYINAGEFAYEEPDAPASLPTVVSVGGTSLQLTSGGARASETVWNDDGSGDELGFPRGYVSGGGCSTRFIAQPWQQGVSGFLASGCGDKRLDNDTSAVADPYTGFDIYDSYDCGPECEEYGIGEGSDWLTLGGTSLTTPLISSLYALAGGSGGVPYPALTLYGHLADAGSLYDVTEGGNGYCDAEPLAECGDPNATYGQVDCEGSTACDAGPGYDGPSGVGTPNGLGAFKPMFPTAAITSSGSLAAGVAASFSAAGSSDPYAGGSIASYAWNWGDGSAVGAGVSPTHVFAHPGVYTVSLTVTDRYGVVSPTVAGSVTVGEGPLEELARARAELEANQRALAEASAAAAKKRGEEEGAAAKKRGEVEATAKKRQEEEAAKTGVLGVKEASPDARIASTTLHVSAAGALSLEISCPAGERTCAGTVTLRTLNAVIAELAGAAKAKPAILTLATGSFTVPGGKTVTVLLHLSAKARALLARLHTLHIRVTVVAHNPEGVRHTTQTIATLHAPKVARPGG